MTLRAFMPLALAFLICPLAGAADGELDPLFAGNGKAVVDFSNGQTPYDATASSAAVQADGKIVVAGYVSGPTAGPGVARLNADGSLDTTFADHGRFSILTDQIAGVYSANHVAIQHDGKIVLFGVAGRQGFVARLLANGAVDSSFGNGVGGVVYPSTGPGTTGAAFFGGVVTASGQILAAGGYDDGTGGGITLLNVLYDSSGNVLFAQNINNVLSDYDGAIALQRDGKALVTSGPGDVCRVVRIDVGATSLSIDTNFGTNGIAAIDWDTTANNDNDCRALAVQRDGKIVVAGEEVLENNAGYRAIVARLMPDGTLDSAFGKKRFVIASNDASAVNAFCGVVVQNDGRIVLAGVAGTSDAAHAPTDFGVVRLLTDGTLDTTFTSSTAGSSLGKVVFGFEVTSSGRRDQGNAVVLQANEPVIVGFRETSAATPLNQFAIARLQNDRLFADGYEP